MFRVRSIVVVVVCFVALTAQAQFGDVTVSKTGPAAVPEGTNVSYDVTVTNIGANAALSVQLSDPIPPGMTFVSATQNSGVAFACTNPGAGNPGTVNCTTATLGAGQSANFTFVFNIGTQATPGEEFANTATVSTTPGDGNPNNNSATARTRTISSDFAVSKSGPAQATAGANVAYDVTLFNSGPDVAPAVRLDDSIPDGMLFVSAVQNSGPAFTCSKPAVNDAVGTVTCNNDAPFPSGATATFTITFNIPPATQDGTLFTNVAISTSATDPATENDAASATTMTPPAPSAEMSIIKNGPASAGPGTDVQYTISVTNGGPNAAASVSWSDTLPGDMTFVSLVHAGWPEGSCMKPDPGAGGTITCTVLIFPVAYTSTYTLTGRIPAQPGASSYQNTATVSSPTHDPNEENNSSTTELTISAVDVSVTKGSPPIGLPGSEIVYTITVSNSGPDGAADVELVDTLPPGTTFLSITQNSGPAFNCSTPAPGTHGTVVCRIALLPANTSAQFMLSSNTGSGVVIVNTATVSTASYDTNSNNNSASTIQIAISQSANLSVAKNGPATVTAGSTITYSVTAMNSGPSNASNPTLQDTLPANTTFASATQNSGPTFTCITPGVGATGTITCTRPTMDAGTAATFTFVFNVSPAATVAVNNTASFSSAFTPDPNLANNSSTVTAIVSQSADLSVTKTGPAAIAAGAQITYTVTARNEGPSDATMVSLSDTLPPNTTFVSATQTSGPAFTCTGPAVGSGGTITCNRALAFAPAATATFSFVLNVSPSATGPITNTASISALTSDPAPGNNSAMTTATVGQSADLTVVKSAPATVAAGTTLTYTVTASNVGPSNAATVALTDVLPPNTTFASINQTSGPTFTCTSPAPGGTGTVNCSIATLAGGGTTATFSLTVNVPPGATGSINNTANITAATSDPTPGNNASTATTAITQSANLAVTKTAPATVVAGSTLTYTITASNAGPSNATNVSLTDTLPANTTFASVTQTSGPTFTCTAPAIGNAGIVSCSIATLTGGGTTATFSLVVNVPPGATGSINNTANITAATSDPTPGNNTSTATTTVTQSGDLAVTKTAPATVVAGSTLTYTITASNAGPSNATNVSLTDTLPANTTFASVTQTSGPTFTCTAPAIGNAGMVNCSIATLAGGGTTATFSLVVNVAPGATGSINNTANITAATTDPTPGNNASTATTTVTQSADLTVTKTGPAAVTAGSNITYTVTANNAGPSNATSVSLTDVLPANTTFVSATQTSGPAFTCTTPPVGSPGTITCTAATFVSGATAVFSFVVNLAPAATGAVNNTAAITSATADPTPGNSSSGLSSAIGAGPTDVSITKTADAVSYKAGSDATFTLAVRNNGPGNAAGTIVTDVLPSGTTLISATPTQGTCTGTTTVVCTLGALAPSATATITLVVHLPQTVGPISNTATVTIANTETAPANNSSTATINVVAEIPALSPLALLLLAMMVAGVGVVMKR